MTAGLCECGCGEKTAVAKRTVASKGWVAGEPLRYVRGHSGGTEQKRRAGHLRRELAAEHGRLWALEAPGVPYGVCQCGCGAETPVADRTRSAARLSGISANPDLILYDPIECTGVEEEWAGGRTPERYRVAYDCQIDSEIRAQASREAISMSMAGSAIEARRKLLPQRFYVSRGRSPVVSR